MLLELIDWARKTLTPGQLCVSCLIVTVGFAYIFSTGYVRADDFKELKARVDLSAQLQLAAEIRAQSAICRAIPDKEPIRRVIEQLQLQYRQITGERYPENPCT